MKKKSKKNVNSNNSNKQFMDVKLDFDTANLNCIGNLHRCPWRSGSDGGLSILRMWVRVQVIASFFLCCFHDSYYSAIQH